MKVVPEQGKAEGFLCREDRRFFLNARQGVAILQGKELRFEPAKIEIRSDDIYVSSELLEVWFPIDLKVERLSSRVQIHALEPLPMQTRLERERRSAGLNSSFSAPDYPHRGIPFLLWDGPFLDQSFSLSTRQGGMLPSANFTTHATAEWLFMSTDLYLAGSERDPLSNFRLSMGRKEPEGTLLGFMRAREFSFGDVFTPSLPLIANSQTGHGFLVSNFPLHQAQQFDRQDFQGVLPSGWDVELYRNNVLFGYQQSKEDGLYRFENVPLLMGMNEFRLLFYGPQGQRREEVHRLNIGASLTPPGEHRYRISSHRDEKGQVRSIAQYDLGIHRQLSASFGLADLSSERGRGRYGEIGLRGVLDNCFLHSDFAFMENGGFAGALGLQTSLGPLNLTGTHTHSHRFSSDLVSASSDPLQNKTELSLTGTPFEHVSTTLDFGRNQFLSGQVMGQVSNQVSGFFERLSLSNRLSWSVGQTQQLFSNGSLQLGSRWGQDGLRGEVSYRPDRIDGLALSVDRRLDQGGYLNGGINVPLDRRQPQYNVGYSRNFGGYTMGANASYSQASGVSLTTNLSFGLSRDVWPPNAQSIANNGAVLARVFLDANQNGRLDQGEKPLEGIELGAFGSSRVKTDQNGCANLTNLPAYQEVDLTLCTDKLEDPLWVPKQKGLRIVPRPGRTAVIDFPILATGEISGTVYMKSQKTKKETGGIHLELLDERGEIVRTIRSGYDGFFTLTAVPSGRYYLRVSSKQAEENDLLVSPREVRIPAEGGYLDGVDLVLQAGAGKHAKKAKVILPSLRQLRSPSEAR